MGAVAYLLDLPPAAQPPARGQGGRLHRAHGPADRRRDLPGRHAGRSWSTRSSRRTTSASSASTSRSTACGWPATIIGLGIVLTVLFRFTRFGLATRASAETEVGALVSGLSPDRIALVNWIISFVVCGIAGVLIAPLVPLVPGHLHAVHRAGAGRGRGRTLPFARVGHHRRAGHRRARVALGLRQRRPPGFPRRRRRAHPAHPGAGRAGRPRPDHAEPRHADRRSRSAGARVRTGASARPSSARAVGIGAIYLFTGNDRAALYASFITGVISLSLVVVTGYTGQISLAQLTLAGVSAYILSTFATSWGIPFPIAPILSALVAAAAGVRDRHPRPARARPHAGRGHVDLRGRGRGHLVQQQLHRRRCGRAGHPDAAAVRHGPRHRVGQGLPPSGLRHPVSRRPGPGGVRRELAAHQPPGHGHAGGAVGRAVGGGGGDQRGPGQADRLRHRRLHRRVGRVACWRTSWGT